MRNSGDRFFRLFKRPIIPHARAMRVSLCVRLRAAVAFTAAAFITFGPLAVFAERAAAFDPVKLERIPPAIQSAIDAGEIPGAVLWLEREGEVYTAVLGDRAREPEREPLTLDTIFDAASLTKVIATTSAVALLMERGEIDLDAPVGTYIPAFARHGKEAVIVRQLLTHTSGLRPGISRPSSYSHAIELACNEKLQTEPGTEFRYSDINFILLGEIVRRVSGESLAAFVRKEIFEPLGMADTGFLPNLDNRERIAPTERTSSGEILRGAVHDPTSRAMGGVAGHAGLFVTAADLARFSRMMLNGGELEGVRLFRPETVALLTSVQTPPGLASRRGLGWDIDSRYSYVRGEHFPIGSYGHTGWTGTSIWIDPFSRTFCVLLTSRCYPDGSGDAIPVRKKVSTLAAEAVNEFDFTHVPGALAPREETEGR